MLWLIICLLSLVASSPTSKHTGLITRGVSSEDESASQGRAETDTGILGVSQAPAIRQAATLVKRTGGPSQAAEGKGKEKSVVDLTKHVVDLTVTPSPSGVGSDQRGQAPPPPGQRLLASSANDALAAGVTHTLALLYDSQQLRSLPVKSFSKVDLRYLGSLKRVEIKKISLYPARVLLQALRPLMTTLMHNPPPESLDIPDGSEWNGAQPQTSYWTFTRWLSLDVSQ